MSRRSDLDLVARVRALVGEASVLLAARGGEAARGAALLDVLPVEVNGRLSRALARIRWDRCPESGDLYRPRLEVSRDLQDAPPAVLLDVVRHEVAHVLAGHSAAHGPLWRAWARVLGCEARPRCSGARLIAAGLGWECPVCHRTGTVSPRSRAGQHLRAADSAGSSPALSHCGGRFVLRRRDLDREARTVWDEAATMRAAGRSSGDGRAAPASGAGDCGGNDTHFPPSPLKPGA